MFSPSQNNTSGPAMATRSRRRQRPASADNSLNQQPKAKRQRVPLTESAYTNPELPSKSQPEMHEVKHDKVARLPFKPDGLENNAPPSATRSLRREVAVRSKKPKQGERSTKSDGSVELTKTNVYTVSKLQALPDRIRADPALRQHGALDASSGFGLCVTHTHALVWQYASTTPSPETFVFTLPYPSKHATDPLPLGALVSPGTPNEEPGLLVVMPVSGKISFWEHISSAATLDFLRQQRNGVEDTIPGMFGGEHVVHVTQVDSAGFILSFSSGRLAHLSVRDGQGKPAISIQFLRASWGQSSGIWDNVFGGIKNALKSAVQRGDLAAVRVDPSNRVGGKNIVAATKNGRLHAWRVQRGGHHEVIANIDAREPILDGLKQVLLPVSNSTEFELVDFAYVPRGIEDKYVQASRLSGALTKDDDSVQHLLLLVSLSSKRQSQYALVELEMEGEVVRVGMVRALSSYTTPVNPSATERPRIYLPRPALVAFIVFDRAVVVASVAALPETPDSQLQEENNAIPATFEDVIDLRNDDALEIVGTGVEEPQGPGQEPETSRSHRAKVKNPTAFLMIRGVGVVKIALSDVDRFGSEQPPEVTAKNKLEQAVFYGLKDDNPIVFEGRRQLPFSDVDIGQAALQLSDDILASRTLPLASGSAVTEVNLRQRSTYLDKLMSHLNTQKVTLDRRTKWQLLANAEKMSMAREVWKLHETFLGDRPPNDKKTIVSEAIECINEEDKKNPDRAAGELDRARTWFLYDVGRLDILLPWTYQMLKNFRKHKLADDPTMTRLIYEGMHVFYETLRGALEYRKRNLDFYGLGDEEMELGILAKEDDYEGLPKFWTATEFTCEYFFRLIELCQMWLETHYPPEAGAGLPDPGLIQSIRDRVPHLIDHLILTLQEFIRWCKGNNDDTVDVDGSRFCDKCERVLANSTELILKLKDFGLWEDALKIAEKFNDNRALAELIVAQISDLSSQTRPGDAGAAGPVKALLDSKKRLFTEYVDRHGASFAFEAYKLLLEQGGPDMVLDFSKSDRHHFATMFLRNDPRLGKISWINDVEREQDLGKAAKTLIEVGQAEEHVWNKKIELSLGKLTLLAEGAGAQERGSAEDRSKAAETDAELVRVEKDLEIVQVQNLTYQMLSPAFQDAVDDEAAVDLAIQAFAPKVPKKHKVLLDDLKHAMGQLVARKAIQPLALINLLTLIRLDEANGVETDLFWNAIRVAELGLHGEQKQRALRLIWRRCYIRDDWSRVNHTENVNDQAVEEVLGQTQAYCAMIGCVTYHMARHDQECFTILTPAAAQGVFVDPDEEPFGSPSDDPALLDKRAEAMRWEETTLKKFIDKNRLSEWAADAYSAADRYVRRRTDKATANGANGSAANLKGNGSAHGHVVQSVERDPEDDNIS